MQVLRVFNMLDNFGNSAPRLKRVPVPGHPYGATFWGGPSAAGACVQGVGEVSDFVTAHISRGDAPVKAKVCVSQLHDTRMASAVGAAQTSEGGVPVFASMTKAQEIVVLVGDGAAARKVATVEPAGIGNYQVPCRFHPWGVHICFEGGGPRAPSAALCRLAPHRRRIQLRHCLSSCRCNSHRMGCSWRRRLGAATSKFGSWFSIRVLASSKAAPR